jgi:hypothetical protein
MLTHGEGGWDIDVENQFLHKAMAKQPENAPVVVLEN